MTTTWGITDGSAGMSAQVAALAQALGLDIRMKRVRVKKAFAWLPNTIFSTPLAYLILPWMIEKNTDVLEKPWPDVVITCGRRAAIVALGMRARAKNTTFICIGDPHTSPSYIDLIVAMEHDKISGKNVIKSRYALHSITPSKLESARAKFSASFAQFPTPRVALLLGGSTNKYRFGKLAMSRVIDDVNNMLENMEGSLLVTPSRRTGEENMAMFCHAFASNPRVYIYDGKGENPYMGMLALADHLVVSNDSVNMMSEARATGKPLYLLELDGHQHTKPSRFAARLLKEGSARKLGRGLESWNYEVRDDMAQLAIAIREKLPL